MALTMEEAQISLYERIGGKAAVEAATDLFYEKIMADDRVNFFFKDVDMPRQRAHQKAFLTYALGGSPHYKGRSLRKAHHKLVEDKGLSDEHFTAVAENLTETLQELGVPAEQIKEVMGIVGSTKDEVLNR